MMKRGQISTEYLIIIGFVVFVIIGIIGFAFSYSASARDGIRFSNLAQFANKIITGAEEVYYAGEPSRAQITAYLPGGVTGVLIQSDYIVFNVTTGSGSSIIAYPSSVPLQGVISANEGVKRINIVAQQSSVLIGEG